jgi:hypothetical protein
MTVREWIHIQPETIQTEIWKRLTVFLTTGELQQVISHIANGEELLQAHEKLGLIDKYNNELNRIAHVIQKHN